MNHKHQVQQLWDFFKFIHNASTEELVKFGFEEIHEDNHRYKLECFLEGDSDPDPAFYIIATKMHGLIKLLVQTSEDASSYQLAGVASLKLRHHYIETNMVRVLEEDTTTIRASNTGDVTWLSDNYGAENTHMVTKTNEAEMFQASLVLNVPHEYIDIQNEMIEMMREEKLSEHIVFDKIILTYTHPIVDLQIPKWDL